MKVVIAVISHGHEDIIRNLNCLEKLSLEESFEVIIKNNKGDSEGGYLQHLANNSNITVIDEVPGLGFGANNNFIFNWAKRNLSLTDEDWFLCLNPDVSIEATTIKEAVIFGSKSEQPLMTINLLKDVDRSISDYNIRNFPRLFDFVLGFLGKNNKSKVDKSRIDSPTYVDWAAGSFLLFKVGLYRQINGFDEAYFMYCEDIDICLRARIKNQVKVMYLPSLTALHTVGHENRKLLSRHFIWFLTSMMRYLVRINTLKVKAKLGILKWKI